MWWKKKTNKIEVPQSLKDTINASGSNFDKFFGEVNALHYYCENGNLFYKNGDGFERVQLKDFPAYPLPDASLNLQRSISLRLQAPNLNLYENATKGYLDDITFD